MLISSSLFLFNVASSVSQLNILSLTNLSTLSSFGSFLNSSLSSLVLNSPNNLDNLFCSSSSSSSSSSLSALGLSKSDPLGIILYLERYIFGEDIESIEPEEKYEESIAETVKTGKQNASSRSPKKDYSAEAADYLKYMEEQEKGQKRFSDDYDSNGSGNVDTSLKILTNKQMLNRLPILLAQIQAGNNSIKLKNEIRQILYSLYRSKALTKTVYNNLIKAI